MTGPTPPPVDQRTLALALCEEFSLFVLKPDDELDLVVIDGQVNMLDAADHLLAKFARPPLHLDDRAIRCLASVARTDVGTAQNWLWNLDLTLGAIPPDD